MRKIIKSDAVNQSEQVVVIPDYPQTSTSFDGNSAPLCAEQDDPTAYSASAIEEQSQNLYDAMLLKAQTDSAALRSKMLEQATKEQEEIIKEAQTASALIKEEAYQEGYAKGLSQRTGEIATALSDLNHALANLEAAQEEFFESYSQEVQNFALDIASKILARQVLVDDAQLVDLVKAAVKSIKNADWLTVKVSEQMPHLIEVLGKDFDPGQKVNGKRVEIVPSELPSGGCIIETPMGTVDISIATQLENLKKFFDRS